MNKNRVAARTLHQSSQLVVIITINKRPLTPKSYSLQPMMSMQNSKPRPPTANEKWKGENLKIKHCSQLNQLVMLTNENNKT